MKTPKEIAEKIRVGMKISPAINGTREQEEEWIEDQIIDYGNQCRKEVWEEAINVVSKIDLE